MRKLLHENRGIEGLPMKLIIIVVIAGVVLAGVLTMWEQLFNPQRNMEIEYQGITDTSDNVTGTSPGSLVKVAAAGAEEVNDIDFTAHIYVHDPGNGDPVSGATVTLAGRGSAAEADTNANGLATVQITGCDLDANTDDAYLTVTVKKSGYRDVTDPDGIHLHRVTG